MTNVALLDFSLGFEQFIMYVKKTPKKCSFFLVFFSLLLF